MEKVNTYKFVIPVSAVELDAYYKIRYEVLRKPWGQEENTVRDEWEDQSLHVMLVDDKGKPVAAGRLQFNSSVEGQIRSMAVMEDNRGTGIGSLILEYLENKAREKKLSKIILDSRDTAVNFYLKNGYKIESSSYLLFGVIPHFRMSKDL